MIPPKNIGPNSIYARSRVWLACTLAVLLCFALNGCVVGDLAMWIQVKAYSGDGVIHNCSLIGWPGYRIEFPKFDSARPYQATYRLNRVPQRLGGEPATLYLRFFWPNNGRIDETKKSVTASFRIILSEKSGTILHSAELQLSSATWGEEQNGRFFVYDLGKSDLQFKHNARYLLNVSYVPGGLPPPAKELYFFIENGCSK